MSLTCSIFAELAWSVGFGHVYRCQAMVQWLNARGWSVRVWIDGDRSAYDKFVASLPTVDFTCHFRPWIRNSAHLLREVRESNLTILDSYAIDQSWLIELESLERPLLFIDDWLHLDYAKSWAVDWSISAFDVSPSSWHNNPRCLMGTDYVVVREAFRAPIPSRHFGSQIERVLIMIGGSDVRSLVPELSRRLHEEYPSISVEAVVPNAEHLPELNGVTFSHGLNAEEICRLMDWADLVICGAGQTMYEVVSRAVPFIPIAVVDNQQKDFAHWQRMPFVPYAFQYDDPELIERILRAVDGVSSPDDRATYVNEMRKMDLRRGIDNLLSQVLAI